MTDSLERATDRAIAAENKRFLSDPQAQAEARAEGTLYAERLGLTQMPDPRLDGITRADLERELRGSVYVAERQLWQAEKGGDRQTIKRARDRLAEVIRYARAEKVRPYWRGKEGKNV